MEFTIVWLLGILLFVHISFITTSSLSLKYQTCMSKKINGFHLYTGTQSSTKSGYPCERWDASNPRHTFDSRITATNRTHRTLQHNYCRTMYPDEHPVPWCYTTTDVKWEECDIKKCSSDKDKDKYDTCMGEKINGFYPYTGTEHVTKSGIQCQRWDSLKPQHHVRDMIIALGRTFLTSQHNYCRTMYPDDNPVPWCYTMDKEERWEECNIIKCNFDRVKDGAVLLSRYKPFYTNNTYEIQKDLRDSNDRTVTKFKTVLNHYTIWDVNLLRMLKINHVNLYNTDTNDNINNDVISISIHLADVEYTNWEKCASFYGDSKNITKRHMFSCVGVGQYIRVEIFHFGSFQLQEVKVFGYPYGTDPMLLYNKAALFVSTSDNEASSPGVIGQIDTKFKTSLSWRNFWKVNLLKQYNISYVMLHNVHTGNHYFTNFLEIAVYIENKEQQNSKRCAYFKGLADDSKKIYRFICEGIGQFIRVEKYKFSSFKLQEVDVFGNTYDDTILLSNNIPAISVSGGSCIKGTDCYFLRSAVWEVNLLRLCQISYVILSSVASHDHTFYDYRKIVIFIIGKEHKKWERCSTFLYSGESSRDINLTKNDTFLCEGIGQYIRVHMDHYGHFKSHEFNVFGYQLHNGEILLLYNKSSTNFPVDEYNMNSYYQTKLNRHNFWNVDLGKEFRIRYMILHNLVAEDMNATHLLKIEIFLANSKAKYKRKCAHYDDKGQKSRKLYNFICEGIGQYIRVENPPLDHFELGAIEVFGYRYYDDTLSLSKVKHLTVSQLLNHELNSYGVDATRYTKVRTSFHSQWEVNLLRMHKISYVILSYYVTDEYNTDAFLNINVYYGGKEYNNWDRCPYFDGPGEQLVNFYVACEGIAQYIRAERSHLIEVFGSTIDTVFLVSANKFTFMSSTYGNDISVHGVDGDNNTKFRTVYHQNYNTWIVDLRNKYKIRYVALYPVHQKDDGDLRRIFIYVTETKDTVKGRCAYFEGPDEKTRTIYRIICEDTGKYVRLEKQDQGFFTLQEVEVYGENYDAVLISRGQPTRMLHGGYGLSSHPSDHGVDGKKHTIFKSSADRYNYWEVNLFRMSRISHITLTNVDSYESDVDGFLSIGVYIGDKEPNNWAKCAYYDGPGEKSVKYTTACEGIAQYIRVTKSILGDFQLQEVEVYGFYVGNTVLLSYKQPTSMSSTYEGDTASHGVDNDMHTKFKTLFNSQSNYWLVDLVKVWNMSYVSLYTVKHTKENDLGDLRKISIYISLEKDTIQNRCAYFGGPNEKSRTKYSLICVGIGQFVRIKKDQKGHLELQEVEVYGKDP